MNISAENKPLLLAFSAIVSLLILIFFEPSDDGLFYFIRISNPCLSRVIFVFRFRGSSLHFSHLIRDQSSY